MAMLLYVFVTLAVVLLQHGLEVYSFTLKQYGGYKTAQRRYGCGCKASLPVRMASGDGGDDESKNFLQSLLGDDYELVNSGMTYEEEVLGYDLSVDDEEVLRDIRMNKMIINDRWQSCHFRDNQGGEWTGSFETYQCVAADAGGAAAVSLRKVGMGTVRSTMTASDFTNEGVSIFIKEVYNDGSANSNALDASAKKAVEMLQKPTRSSFKPTDFRIIGGNQIVANVFTLNSVSPAGPERDPLAAIAEIRDFAPDHYIGEIGVKEGLIRTRVRFAYAADSSSSSLLAEEKALYPLGLVGLTVIREALLSASPADVQLLLDSKAGPGIYDPQVEGEPYVQINLPGRLSLLFPRGVVSGEKQSLTIEWEGSTMRYQTDRKFVDLTGAIASLELTEVRIAEAEKYKGGF